MGSLVTDFVAFMVIFLSCLLLLSFDFDFHNPPKIMAMNSPNPNIAHERIVIHVRTAVDTDFT